MGSSPAIGSTRSTCATSSCPTSTPYSGDEKFLAGASKRTKAVWDKLQPYFQEERKKGVLAVDAKTPSTLLAHKAGYIDRANEVIVGLQTDAAVQACHISLRRTAHGRGGPEGSRVRSRPAGPRSFHQVSQDAQRRRVRRLHARDHGVPQVGHHHRAFPTPMAAAVSSATIGASHSTASTVCSRPSARSGRKSTICGRPTR